MLRYEEKPCLFDGKSINVFDYFVHFETVSHWNQWTVEEMACQLIINLRGEAQTILRFLQKQQLTNYDYLKNLLKQRFNPKEREAYFKIELKTCKLKERETISEFGQRFKSLAYNAYPDNYFGLEMYFTDLFISVLDVDMAKFVTFKHPCSLDDAISLALEYETFGVVNGDRQEADLYVQSSCCLDAVHKSFQDLVKLLKKAVKSERKRKPKKCFNCLQSGHIRSNCPNKVVKVQSNNKVNCLANEVIKCTDFASADPNSSKSCCSNHITFV